MQDDCGFYLASLCPEGDVGCASEDGGYEVTMPEPIIPGDGYRVRISQVGADMARCSDNFYLMGSDTERNDPSITVASPDVDSVALAGKEYMVEVRDHEAVIAGLRLDECVS